MQQKVNTDHEGPYGLIMLHYKAQSFVEFKGAMAWNKFADEKFSYSGVEDESRNLEFQNTGATHSAMLLQLPQMCYTSLDSSALQAQLSVCSLESLCLNCAALQWQHKCQTSGLNELLPSLFDQNKDSVTITGNHTTEVMGKASFGLE